MKGRPRTHKDNELVLAAQEIFWRKGYSATSLKDLSAATKAGSGSLYNTFKGGKKELFKKALLQRRADLNRFRGQIETADDPIQLIKDFFYSIPKAGKQEHLKGCIVANTLVEMTFVDDELREEATRILKETEELYTAAIRKQQKRGSLKSTVPAEVLGKYLITFWCGINSLRRMYPNKRILEQQIVLHLQVLV